MNVKSVLALLVLVLFNVTGCAKNSQNSLGSAAIGSGYLAVPMQVGVINMSSALLVMEGTYANENQVPKSFTIRLPVIGVQDHFAFSQPLPEGKYELRSYEFMGAHKIFTGNQEKSSDPLSGGPQEIVVESGKITLFKSVLTIKAETIHNQLKYSWRWIDESESEYSIADYERLLEVEQNSKAWSKKLAKAEKAKKQGAVFEVQRNSGLILLSDSTLIDQENGLMWASKDNGFDLDWYTAKKYCNNSNLAGYDDWRMPTESELKVLIDKTRSLNETSGSLLETTGIFAWTSKKRGDVSAVMVNLQSGGAIMFHPNNRKMNRAFPVRNLTGKEQLPPL